MIEVDRLIDGSQSINTEGYYVFPILDFALNMSLQNVEYRKKFDPSVGFYQQQPVHQVMMNYHDVSVADLMLGGLDIISIILIHPRGGNTIGVKSKMVMVEDGWTVLPVQTMSSYYKEIVPTTIISSGLTPVKRQQVDLMNDGRSRDRAFYVKTPYKVVQYGILGERSIPRLDPVKRVNHKRKVTTNSIDSGRKPEGPQGLTGNDLLNWAIEQGRKR